MFEEYNLQCRNERITLLILALIGFIIIILLLFKTDPYYQVESGKRDLACFLKGKGWTKVPREKIVGYIDDKNIWIFKNGYARNCRLIRHTKE